MQNRTRPSTETYVAECRFHGETPFYAKKRRCMRCIVERRDRVRAIKRARLEQQEVEEEADDDVTDAVAVCDCLASQQWYFAGAHTHVDVAAVKSHGADVVATLDKSVTHVYVGNAFPPGENTPLIRKVATLVSPTSTLWRHVVSCSAECEADTTLVESKRLRKWLHVTKVL